MNHSQQELRHAAARAFMESLEQLNQRLNVSDDSNGAANGHGDKSPDIASSDACSPNPSNSAITVQELEEAVADIEQFTRTKDQ